MLFCLFLWFRCSSWNLVVSLFFFFFSLGVSTSEERLHFQSSTGGVNVKNGNSSPFNSYPTQTRNCFRIRPRQMPLQSSHSTRSCGRFSYHVACVLSSTRPTCSTSFPQSRHSRRHCRPNRTYFHRTPRLPNTSTTFSTRLRSSPSVASPTMQQPRHHWFQCRGVSCHSSTRCCYGYCYCCCWLH
uniref:Uncharacterized protein n=1 Tax=Cacopsylla melanoneura TaxID=428564 RepID=A0A8D8VIM7_9HEMI